MSYYYPVDPFAVVGSSSFAAPCASSTALPETQDSDIFNSFPPWRPFQQFYGSNHDWSSSPAMPMYNNCKGSFDAVDATRYPRNSYSNAHWVDPVYVGAEHRPLSALSTWGGSEQGVSAPNLPESGRTHVESTGVWVPSLPPTPIIPPTLLPTPTLSRKGSRKASTSKHLRTAARSARTTGNNAMADKCHVADCSFRSKRSGDMTRHRESVHDRRRYECPNCSRLLCRADAVMRHQKSRDGSACKNYKARLLKKRQEDRQIERAAAAATPMDLDDYSD